jgi:hypothetical protein
MVCARRDFAAPTVTSALYDGETTGSEQIAVATMG